MCESWLFCIVFDVFAFSFDIGSCYIVKAGLELIRYPGLALNS